MNKNMRVVVVGGVAAGPKVASRISRLNPEAEVTIIEKGFFLSYAGCGLPYYVSGAVKSQKELMCTPIGVVRDPSFFKNVKNVTVFNRTEAVEIDRKNKKVAVAPVDNKENVQWLPYDKLVLCTGANPVYPPIPGAKLNGIHTLHKVEDAEAIKEVLINRKAHNVVVVGGGLIGVEMTESLVELGCKVTVVEKLPQILTILDTHMARLVERHMEFKGMRIMTNTTVESFIPAESDVKHVGAVNTTAGQIPADLVIMSIGVRPNVGLAKAAGIEIGEKTGAIKVDARMRTSDPDIYAAGDCAEVTHLMTGQHTFIPLGSTANKQGRVAANAICGINDSFKGVMGSAVCRVFDFCVARTGLSEREANAAGFEVEVAMTPAPDRAHFMPTAKPMMLKLVADRKTRKLLGAQSVGAGSGDKRIDVAAMALTGGLTVDELSHADLCYAPPYAPAMDNIITVADMLRNKLDGLMNGVSAEQLHNELQSDNPPLLLDVRTPDEVKQMALPGSLFIPLGKLRGRINEVPRDRPIVCFCKASLRGYEAARILLAAGYDNIRVLDGGLAMWPY